MVMRYLERCQLLIPDRSGVSPRRSGNGSHEHDWGAGGYAGSSWTAREVEVLAGSPGTNCPQRTAGPDYAINGHNLPFSGYLPVSGVLISKSGARPARFSCRHLTALSSHVYTCRCQMV